jgi:ankyrin repeat protein
MPLSYELHQLAQHGDVQRLRDFLNTFPEGLDINAYDRFGRTPLMQAVRSPKASVELVRLLLDHGANIHQESSNHGETFSVISLALAGGDPQKVNALLECGADIHYTNKAGYDALINAVHGRDVLRDLHLIELLKILIARGVALSGVTIYKESGLRVLSRIGRFDAVHLLLDAGADATHLQWTPLIRAVAFGSLREVKETIEPGGALEEKDWWDRTAWLVAVQTGDISKAKVLLEKGANAEARGRCKEPPLFYAIQSHHGPMLQWLLEIGTSVEQTDEFNTTPLMCAVESDNAEAVEILLKAGADVNGENGYNQTPLSFVRTREIAIKLLDAGADPAKLPFEGRRVLLGFDPDPDESQLRASDSEFRSGRARRFGTMNPEKILDPFWEGMIRSGIAAFEAAQFYEARADGDNSPIWCAQRFGQSITFLPDGRIVQVGGEHEDFYDQDFCIYNDVFVHAPDKTISILAYPKLAFPPTDFHTATLVGEYIYLIGSLGYPGTRLYGETPIYRLHIGTFQIESVEARGEAPGWIYGHRAIQLTAHEIRFIGGKIVTFDGENEIHSANDRSFVLDTMRLFWRLAGDSRSDLCPEPLP